MELKDILARCDHTLLRVDAGADEIRGICDQAVKYGCASVCIPPCHVKGAKNYLGDKMAVCTVIGFPNGYMTTAAKAFETADAVKNGADEIDMVINLAMVKDAARESVAEDIAAVRAACAGKVLKVIIECCLLTDDEKRCSAASCPIPARTSSRRARASRRAALRARTWPCCAPAATAR